MEWKSVAPGQELNKRMLQTVQQGQVETSPCGTWCCSTGLTTNTYLIIKFMSEILRT